MSETILGPVGGLGGQEFGDYRVPAGARLTEIHVYTDKYIDALQFVYSDGAGQIVTMPKVGGLGGQQFIIALGDDEYITAISGTYDWYIDTIRFHTNHRITETYGGQGAVHEFLLEAPADQEICGLFGKNDWFLDSLGGLARPRGAAAEQPAAPAPADEAAPAAEPAPAAKPKAAGKAKSSGKAKVGNDDLTKIEGIGPKIAQHLSDNGISNHATLASTPIDQLREILKSGGSRLAVADPSTWPEQAALAAKGEWGELKNLQARLKSSKR
jgi:predicted flap endonuclease-1-like 5' DNA nuclease